MKLKERMKNKRKELVKNDRKLKLRMRELSRTMSALDRKFFKDKQKLHDINVFISNQARFIFSNGEKIALLDELRYGKKGHYNYRICERCGQYYILKGPLCHCCQIVTETLKEDL